MEPPTEAAPGRERGGGGPWGGRWLWALGGAVLASALWAGGLYALGDRLAEPPMAYRLPEKLCDSMKGTALTAALGDLRKDAPTSMNSEHPALDWGMCSLSTAPPNDGSGNKVGSFNVWATVQLHKKTDPAAEFDVENPWERGGFTADRASVPDLGERAVMTPASDAQGPELKVLDGGAVFSLLVSPFGGGDPMRPPGTGRVDYAPIEAAMIADMRALMAAVKK
ncbi:hypothetical protein OHS33_23430 [Streptomyces sp. NBC_00536]|uniref:hypothetical protein n=1 Tax=Streptomyces sp. NBC_00536 TaxID=2975769 RepID=UPI002E81DA17|nr:hypothetical protein [Streptomyces sp. NBC_00536]WUC81025.1 hypothetical protein OHS33_23430 [Streptomyces sp. NBC_00536]